MAKGDKRPVVMQSDRAVNGGIATLDASGNVPREQLGNVVRPQLLINWDLANPVNQRGQTEYSGGYGYTIDRWRNNNALDNIAVDNENNQISVSLTAMSNFIQVVELEPGEYTFSILVSGAGDNLTLMIPGNPWAGDLSKPGITSATFTVAERSTVSVGVFGNVTGTVYLRAAKLELGSVQTLAHQDADGNWVLNEIPDYGEELHKCQRYFINGTWLGHFKKYISSYSYGVNLPVTMRAIPNVTITRFVAPGAKTLTPTEGGINNPNWIRTPGGFTGMVDFPDTDLLDYVIEIDYKASADL